jgi:hypothetical protein
MKNGVYCQYENAVACSRTFALGGENRGRVGKILASGAQNVLRLEKIVWQGGKFIVRELFILEKEIMYDMGKG